MPQRYALPVVAAVPLTLRPFACRARETSVAHTVPFDASTPPAANYNFVSNVGKLGDVAERSSGWACPDRAVPAGKSVGTFANA